MRAPPTISKRSRITSRSRNAYQNIEIAPSSSAEVPSQTRWEWMRFSSQSAMRIHVALRGTSRPSSCSMASTKTSSLFWNET
jgi:hypothetical protein